ncbi:hypothetical protein PENSPDRAFT_219095 [Peniophora sp. CONT]|nr:hypothetical protein PENSPDRAFT_219095 [Peniophora sp. CONT]
MSRIFNDAHSSSSCVPRLAHLFMVQTVGAASPTATPVPVPATTFDSQLATPAATASHTSASIAVPVTTTAFVKVYAVQPHFPTVSLTESQNETYTQYAQPEETETTAAPKLNSSWTSYASTSDTAFSPARSTATLADITYETMQRQIERICSFEAAELCDGDKVHIRAPSTLDQPAPPKDLGQWRSSHESGGAYGRVRVQETVPDYMRSPSASLLPPPSWSPEPACGGHNDNEKDYVPELMYAPSPSSFPAPNWGPEPDWFADFPAPNSPFSSGSSALSTTSHGELIVASPRPCRTLQVHATHIAHLESEAAVMVAEQEAHAWEMQAAREWAEERLERERAQEACRAQKARRCMRALAAAGGKVAGDGASAAAWVEREAESAWHFGPVRRRKA